MTAWLVDRVAKCASAMHTLTKSSLGPGASEQHVLDHSTREGGGVGDQELDACLPALLDNAVDPKGAQAPDICHTRCIAAARAKVGAAQIQHLWGHNIMCT